MTTIWKADNGEVNRSRHDEAGGSMDGRYLPHSESILCVSQAGRYEWLNAAGGLRLPRVGEAELPFAPKKHEACAAPSERSGE